MVIIKLLILIFTYIDTVIQKTRELFNISSTDECRLWECAMSHFSALVTDLDKTLSKHFDDEIVSIIINEKKVNVFF